MSPNELDSYLKNKHSLGLHPFGIILGFSIIYGDITRYDWAPDTIDLKELLTRLNTIKSRIISYIKEYEFIYKKNQDIKGFYKKNEDYLLECLKEKYKLKEFFDFIDKKTANFSKIIKTRKPGTPIRKANLILSLWSYLIFSKKNQLDWNLIADLFDWFWNRLKSYKLYHILNPNNKESDIDYFRSQFYRNREKCSKIFNKIEEMYFDNGLASISETVILGEYHTKIIDPSPLLEIFTNEFFQEEEDIYVLESILFGQIKPPLIPQGLLLAAYEYHISGYSVIGEPEIPPKIMFPDLSCLD